MKLKGVNSFKNFDSESRIRLTNIVAVIVSCVAFPYIFIFRNYSTGLSNFIIGIIAAFLCVLWLNKRKYHDAAKFLLLLSTNISAAYYAVSFGKEAGIQYLFFAYIGVPMVIFEFQQIPKIFLGSLISVLCMIYLESTHYLSPTPVFSSPEFQNNIRLTAIVFVSVIIVLSLIFLLSTLAELYHTLISTNKNLIESNNSLSAALTSLEKTNSSLTITLSDLETSNALVQSLAQQATLGAILRGIMHEVKGPLTSIRAGCSLILMEDNLSPSIKENIEAMQEAIQNVVELVRTMLADAGSVVWMDSPIELVRVFDQVLKLVENEGFTKNIKIVKNIPTELPIVKGASAYVSQALLNILLNAIRFSPEHSKIKVDVETDETWVKIYVADFGPGINPSIREKLFEKGITTASPGEDSHVGLGLHFVKRVMDAHKGVVSVVNSSPQGATFMMALPIWKENL